MTNKLTKLATLTYIPPVKYVPGVPARCVTDTYTTREYVYLGGGFGFDNGVSYTRNGVGGSGATHVQEYLDVSLNSKTNRYAIVYSTREITTCYPAIPEVPAQASKVSVNSQVGWNASARSVRAVVGNIRAEFVFPVNPVGVACGLGNGLAANQLAGIEHGFYCVGGQIRVIESGVNKADVPVSPNGQPVLRILRNELGTVTYLVDDWSYTSSVTSFGAKYLQASLYAAGDFVDSPLLSSYGDITGTSSFGWETSVAADVVSGDDVFGWAADPVYMTDDANVAFVIGQSKFGWKADPLALAYFVDLQFTPQRFGWSTVNNAATVGDAPIKLKAMGADRPYTYGNAIVPGVVISADAGFPTVESSVGTATLPVYTGGTSLTGGVMSGGAVFELRTRAADRPYADASAVVPVLTFAYDFPEPDGRIEAYNIALVDSYLTDPILYAFISEGVNIGMSVDIAIWITADLAEFLAIADEMSPAMIIEALLRSGFNVSDNLVRAKQVALQYATNIATGGVTRYDNFEFTSFCTVGQMTYGVRSDGLYRIGDADTDDGELIDALVDFGADDLDSDMRKRIDTVFVGLATDGQLYLRMTDENGQELNHKLIYNTEDMHRFGFAKGRDSRFWTLRCEIADASRAELDTVKWFAGHTGKIKNSPVKKR